MKKIVKTKSRKMLQNVLRMALGIVTRGLVLSPAPTATSSDPWNEKAAATSTAQKLTNFALGPSVKKGANAPGSFQYWKPM